MLDILETLAIAAGKEILAVYNAGPNVTFKNDASPVTEADERAEAIILEGLSKAFPDIPVVAEESVAAGRIPDVEGKSFFRSNSGYLVNLRHVLGVQGNSSLLVDGHDLQISRSRKKAFLAALTDHLGARAT